VFFASLAPLILTSCGRDPQPQQAVNVNITLEVPEGTTVRRVPIARVATEPLPDPPPLPAYTKQTEPEPEGTLFDVAP